MEGAPPGDRPDRLSRFRSFDSPGARGEFEPFLRRLAALVLLVFGIVAAGSIAYSLTESVSVWQGFLFTLDTVATVGSDPTPAGPPRPDRQGSADRPGRGYALLRPGDGHGVLRRRAPGRDPRGAPHPEQDRRPLRPPPDLRLRPRRAAGRPRSAAPATSFVVIDELDDNKHIADQMGAPFLQGGPSDDEMLQAGRDRARRSPCSPASTPTPRTSSSA